ncbi:hypothetical protein GA0070613_1925 [Micromonospora inositola]|uniref:Flagellar basal body-associated protein FliL n=1 Tax=Micromonospora inositola TaxID=47865 RepID=A0A1C5HWN9_9ACTN|nr:hypothetical protein GA0070613_1925 [Micromonospora inositola]
MTNFGPPVGGSREPWGGRRPDDAYAPPADPRYDAQPGGWGEPPAQRYEPTAGTGWEGQTPGQPTYASGYPPYQPTAQGYPPAGQPGYPPAAPYVGDAHPYADPPPPPKRGKGPLIAVLAVLAVLVLGGAATYLLGRDDPAPVAGSTQPSDPGAEPSAAASAPDAPAATAPAPASSADPRFVKAGQCVRNEGPAGGKPKLLISGCGAKTYQVLRRFDGATSGEKDAQAKCAKVDGYTNWYFFDSELDTLDFVLCLKQR